MKLLQTIISLLGFVASPLCDMLEKHQTVMNTTIITTTTTTAASFATVTEPPFPLDDVEEEDFESCFDKYDKSDMYTAQRQYLESVWGNANNVLCHQDDAACLTEALKSLMQRRAESLFDDIAANARLEKETRDSILQDVATKASSTLDTLMDHLQWDVAIKTYPHTLFPTLRLVTYEFFEYFFAKDTTVELIEKSAHVAQQGFSKAFSRAVYEHSSVDKAWDVLNGGMAPDVWAAFYHSDVFYPVLHLVRNAVYEKVSEFVKDRFVPQLIKGWFFTSNDAKQTATDTHANRAGKSQPPFANRAGKSQPKEEKQEFDRWCHFLWTALVISAVAYKYLICPILHLLGIRRSSFQDQNNTGSASSTDGHQGSRPRYQPPPPQPQQQQTVVDPWKILGVSRRAAFTEIKKAYHKKAVRFHPDKNVGMEQAVRDKWDQIQAAYDFLKPLEASN